MAIYYKLEGHKAVPCTYPNFEVDRSVALTDVGDVCVSTIFLVVNHNYGNGPPLLFETMIFGGPEDQFQQRYSTWDEAVEGHEKIRAWVRRDYKEVKQ